MNAAAGTIRELVELGVGNTVFASYTTDFVVPDTYRCRSTARLTSTSTGKWTGKSLVDGTYNAEHLDLAP